MEKLRVAFDAKRAVCNNTGLGNYSRLVIDVLSESYPQNDYLLYSPVRRKNVKLDALLARDNLTMAYPDSWIGRMAPSIWRTTGIARQIDPGAVDLFHGLSGELPLNIEKIHVPSVVTVHDLIFRHYPRYYKRIDRGIYDRKFRHAATIANRVIAISDRTRQDLIDFYGTSPEKIDVVYQGCDPIFSVPVTEKEKKELREKYSLPEAFFVAVGTVEPRKNQLLAVKALRGLPEEICLVIAGRRASSAKALEEYIASRGLSSRVRFLENIPFESLPALYSTALFSSYTSRFEGFGLPVVESIASGTPVIAASGSCLEETGGDGALYVDPDDVDQFIGHASRLILDSSYRAEIVKKGQEHIKKFSRDNMAKGIISCYEKAIAAAKSR